MLGGEVGRMRREAWAKDLHAGAKSDRKLAAARLREVEHGRTEGGASRRAVAAFFVDDGAGDAEREREARERQSDHRKRCGQRIPSLLIGSAPRAESPHRFARAPARRDGARAQRRPVRSRDGDPFNLRADEGRARRARFRRPDRPRARASDPARAPPGCCTSSTMVSITCCSTKPRTPLRHNGAFWRGSPRNSSPAPARAARTAPCSRLATKSSRSSAFAARPPRCWPK